MFAKSFVVIAAAFLVAMPASATVQGTGWAQSSLKLSVVDLTPDDGIPAWPLYGNADKRFTASYSVGNWPNVYSGSLTAQPTFSPVPLSRSLAYDGAKVEVRSTGEFGNARSNFTSTLEATSEQPWYQQLQTSVTQNQRILLKANSALTVTGSVEGHLAPIDMGDQPVGFSLNSRIGASLSFISVDGPEQKVEKLWYTHDDTNAYAQEFTLSAVNNNDFDVELALSVNIINSFNGSYWVATPVPEPTSWLMLAVGVLAISGRAWRKAQSASV